MTAGATSCSCTVCGTVCTGRFAGCAAVWARGPKEVTLGAPHTGRLNGDSAAPPTEGERWRLPLADPIRQPAPAVVVTEAERVIASPEPEPAPLPEPVAAKAEPAIDESREFEAPDVTTRYAVAQLGELNERLAELTELTAERTERALEKVHGELRRITSLREVDLTEQAAGIFGAVQAGADALASFASVVTEVTDDLRSILKASLESIGGTEGLAAWVAESASELTDIREETSSSLARIERDLAVLRKRKTEAAVIPADMTLNDDQLTFIVEAVVEAVVTAIKPDATRQRRRY